MTVYGLILCQMTVFVLSAVLGAPEVYRVSLKETQVVTTPNFVKYFSNSM